MAQIVYVGPLGAVDVPLHRISAAAHGVPIDVTDDVAADLLQQTGTWAPVKATKGDKNTEKQEG